jgi:arylsulfatase A-like enzyme
LEAPTHLIDKCRKRRGEPERRLEGDSPRNPDEDVYAAMVDSMDGAVGKVLGALTAEGIAERTVVVFLSDNGAARSAGGNLPFKGFKKDTYEGHAGVDE